jgi:predicted alpha/beta hydrolase|tara:strand:+ start:418 stop:567 length:150 start_codon:yes stop_codon:yes gene_type:complete
MAEGCPRHRRVVIAHPFGGQAQGYHGTLALIAFHFHGAAAQFHKLFRER